MARTGGGLAIGVTKRRIGNWRGQEADGEAGPEERGEQRCAAGEGGAHRWDLGFSVSGAT